MKSLPAPKTLWVVDHRIETTLRRFAQPAQGGVVCFHPRHDDHDPRRCARDVANLSEGDFAQTADYGRAEVLWLGQWARDRCVAAGRAIT